ncbi:MAG: DUF1064 domain-containing protein [Tissierellia bacterium]|nr:DUF1064 domain-containing protein [Tissierellia bacterium]
MLGITFDSALEAERYLQLKAMEQMGAITDLELQPRFVLQESFRHEGKTIRKIEYVADFMYKDKKSGEIHVEDVKGMQTDVYKIKKKIFLNQYGDQLKFEEVTEC